MFSLVRLREYGETGVQGAERGNLSGQQKIGTRRTTVDDKEFELSQVISEIDNSWKTESFIRKILTWHEVFRAIKKMEVWFICKVYFDNSRILRKVVDLCQSGTQNDAENSWLLPDILFGNSER